jgi:flagellar basal-body rod modification protein FlgD
MAESVNGMFTSSAEQIASNYEKYKDNFAKDPTQSLGQMDFLNLMVEQLKNQDFNNPQSDTEFIAQMAQFSALEAQQQNLLYAQGNYATSLLGKAVKVGTVTEDSVNVADQGLVTSVFKQGEDYYVLVNNQKYKLSQVIGVDEAYQVNPEKFAGEASADVIEDEFSDILEDTSLFETI